MVHFTALLILLILLPSCIHVYHIKENLSPNQLEELTIMRKPTGEKSNTIFPIYADYLEGYLLGGIMNSKGEPLSGVTVKIQDQERKDYPGFQTGASDKFGIYRIRFSIPIHWNKIDVHACISCSSGWTEKTPHTEFRLFFDRQTGIIACSPQKIWTLAGNPDEDKSASEPPWKRKKGKTSSSSSQSEPEKKSDDFLSGFNFAP